MEYVWSIYGESSKEEWKNSGVPCMEKPLFFGEKSRERKENSHTAKKFTMN